MCEPTSTASLLAIGAQALIGGIQATAQHTAERQQAAAETQAANNAYYSDMLALQEQAFQQKSFTDMKTFERQRQGLRERARLLVAAGDAGISGNSTLRSLAQSYWDQSHDTGILSQNQENDRYASELQAQRVWAAREGRVNAARSRVSNPFLSVLKIGANAATGYYATKPL